ncbi:MAG: glycosyl transferase, group 2 family protein [Verrucomicrobiaceae bacterium]|nr:glycosyl transferase, group 2 family protein [Verrucomicrobiaceae bacterium]
MTDRVLLVIPCFRESGRIGPFLASLRESFHDDDAITVVVVEDGGGAAEQDKMRALVDLERARWPGLRPLLALDTNLGKGGAVHAGWAAREQHQWLAFVDADGSCPAYEVKALVALARRQPATALFASRVCMLGKHIRRDFHRHLIGRVYATVVSELLRIPVYDSQCGLKCIPVAAFEKILPLCQVPGFAFDVELLCLLLDSGCKVQEVPIDWHETPGGKVRLMHDSFRMFRDVLEIRRRRQSSEWRQAVNNGQVPR